MTELASMPNYIPFESFEVGQVDKFGAYKVTEAEIIEFASLAPATVVANHLEALNHCPTTRDQLRAALDSSGLIDKTLIPADGEVLTIAN